MNRKSSFVPKSGTLRQAILFILYFPLLGLFQAYSATVYVCPEDFPLAPNDTQAIQMAIDDAAANQKVVLLKANKTYNIEATLDGKGVSIMGNNAVFKQKNFINNIRMLEYIGHDVFFIRDLRFNGNQFNIDITTNRHIVWIEDSQNVRLENCRLYNVGTHVLRFENCDRVVVEGCNFNFVGIKRVKPATNVDAIYITNTNDYLGKKRGNIKIHNCSFQNIGGRLKDADAIQTSMPQVMNGDELHSIIVSNNYFYNIQARCMKFQSGNSLTVADNIANKCKEFVGHARQFQGEFETITGNTVTDTEVFYEMGIGDASLMFPAETYKNIVIDGNNFHNGDHFVINSNGGTMDEVKITDNVVTNITGWALRGGGNHITLMDNHVENVEATTTGYQVILTSGGRIRIEGNTFTSANQDLAVVNIWEVDNAGNPIQYNIVRHNLFDTQHNGSTNWIIHPDTYNEPTNILLID